jgi:hypothetical protein
MKRHELAVLRHRLREYQRSITTTHAEIRQGIKYGRYSTVRTELEHLHLLESEAIQVARQLDELESQKPAPWWKGSPRNHYDLPVPPRNSRSGGSP